MVPCRLEYLCSNIRRESLAWNGERLLCLLVSTMIPHQILMEFDLNHLQVYQNRGKSVNSRSNVFVSWQGERTAKAQQKLYLLRSRVGTDTSHRRLVTGTSNMQVDATAA